MGGLSFGMDMSMNMGGGFSPFAVGQPIVLLDAAKGITLNGADVSGWADQSGRANNAAQASATEQPLWNAASANFTGQPSLGFDGTEWMSTANYVDGDIPQPNNIFVAYKYDSVASSEALVDGRISGKRNHIWTNGTSSQIFAGGAYTTGITSDTNPHVGAYLVNGASSLEYRDGTVGAGSGTSSTNPMDGVTIGAAILGAGSALNGEIAYILIYDFELTAVQRNYIGRGLAARFGTTDGWV